VYLGKERLGPADSEIRLAFGRQPVELTLMAPAFKPAALSVTPDRSQTIAAPALQPVRARGPRAQQKEYENPF
jgi:hypothetical protein